MKEKALSTVHGNSLSKPPFTLWFTTFTVLSECNKTGFWLVFKQNFTIQQEIKKLIIQFKYNNNK